ncbi:DUF1127 domain-containing protein [Mesorhizobium sp. WSM3862]|uniref:DUF1127 domain-containing protein n=1 Tax=Mesorhizobium sp. WSM3862 TaxID=632858 RepID=UPI0015970207|nr:DUF1127 domain-containing protein [Mesorhizobium sp. WSM3862]
MDANFNNVVAFRRARTSNPPLRTEANAGEVRPIRYGVCSAIASRAVQGELQWMRLTRLSAIFSFFKEKLERQRSHRTLMELTDAQLQDIGLSRVDIVDGHCGKFTCAAARTVTGRLRSAFPRCTRHAHPRQPSLAQIVARMAAPPGEEKYGHAETVERLQRTRKASTQQEKRVMQYMALTRRRTESFDDAHYTPERLEGEAEGVRRLFMAGVVRQIWNRGDMGGACLLMEGEELEDVRSALNALPLFQSGMQETVSIVPLRPYTGFGPRQ